MMSIARSLLPTTYGARCPQVSLCKDSGSGLSPCFTYPITRFVSSYFVAMIFGFAGIATILSIWSYSRPIEKLFSTYRTRLGFLFTMIVSWMNLLISELAFITTKLLWFMSPVIEIFTAKSASGSNNSTHTNIFVVKSPVGRTFSRTKSGDTVTAIASDNVFLTALFTSLYEFHCSTTFIV